MNSVAKPLGYPEIHTGGVVSDVRYIFDAGETFPRISLCTDETSTVPVIETGTPPGLFKLNEPEAVSPLPVEAVSKITPGVDSPKTGVTLSAMAFAVIVTAPPFLTVTLSDSPFLSVTPGLIFKAGFPDSFIIPAFAPVPPSPARTSLIGLFTIGPAAIYGSDAAPLLPSMSLKAATILSPALTAISNALSPAESIVWESFHAAPPSVENIGTSDVTPSPMFLKVILPDSEFTKKSPSASLLFLGIVTGFDCAAIQVFPFASA